MNNIDLNRLDLNLLKAFQVLLAEQNVGRAAAKMNVSQSAMSHTLGRLRKAFGDELFVRTANGMAPNARALKLGEKITPLLQDIASLLEPDEFAPTAIKSRFRIQTHDYIAASYLPELLAPIRRKAPGVIFEFQNISPSCYEMLQQGKSDLIIGAGLNAGKHFEKALFVEDELCCLLDKKHPALKQWTAERVFDYPHIKMTLLQEYQDPVSIYCKQHLQRVRNIGMYTEALHLQPAFLPGTELIAFVPRNLAVQTAKHYRLQIMACPFDLPKLSVRGIWHERHNRDPASSWIRAQLLDTGI